MSHDPRSQPHDAAIAQLEAFRLSTYAARTYVGLVRVGTATAKEVSEVAEVPRTRVYDAVEELREHGFVDVEASNPQQFSAVSTERLRRELDREYRQRLSVLMTALDCLEPEQSGVDSGMIRTIESGEEIDSRLQELVDEAENEVVYLADNRSLSAAFAAALSRAADRDVSITVGWVSDDQLERLRTEVPNAVRITPSLQPSMIVRLLLIDGRKALVGIQPDETAPDSETATVAAGDTNSLVVLLSSLLGSENEASRSDA